MKAIIHDAAQKRWLRFQNPVEVITAYRVDEVLSVLHRVEERVNREMLFAAGFISYEASPAFDPALHVRPTDAFPLLLFGLFRDAVPAELHATDTSHFTLDAWKPSVQREEYDDAIARIKACIQRGDTYQVNYSFRLRSRFAGEPFALFQHLTSAQPSLNNAFIETGDFAICSASPELFFSLQGEKICARPMKGTAQRGVTLRHDKRQRATLHLSEKNRAENLMIVDMMRNDLGRIAETGSVNVPSLFDIEQYPTVHQMTSTVTAKTVAPVAAILSALFPCASITGAPKASTMRIIAELESTPRKIYTGAIGFIAPQRQAQFNVAIRTILIDKSDGNAEYGVGGGIVWGSTADDEYTECLMKAQLLSETRQQFSLFETILLSPADGFFLLDEHLARIKDSAEYYGFAYHEPGMREELEKVWRTATETLRVKLVLARDGSCSVLAVPLTPASAEKVVHVRLASASIDSHNSFLYHKTSHRIMYEQAMTSVPECDDVILWNERGEITESTIANVVVEIDGELRTPPVECGLLGGVFRAQLLQEGTIKERTVTIDELKSSSRIFLVNSLRKWREARLLS